MGSGLRPGRDRPRPPQLTGLAPVGSRQPRALILGSFPGRASLADGKYYAHPRNQFWPIMAELFGFGAQLPYQQRLAHLAARRIALWDVLASARRVGSADARIETSSMRSNDIAGLFDSTCPPVAVALNGGFAGRAWQRYLDANRPVAQLLADATVMVMPSTSPAYASKSKDAKLEQWRQLARVLDRVDN